MNIFLFLLREKVKKLVKARDSYGLVFDDVKKIEAMKQLRVIEAGPNPPPPGTLEDSGVNGQNVDGAVVPYMEPGALRPIGTGPGLGPAPGQLQPLRKAPTMPKPRWHAPWKLYRVIAGHLGKTDVILCIIL